MTFDRNTAVLRKTPAPPGHDVCCIPTTIVGLSSPADTENNPSFPYASETEPLPAPCYGGIWSQDASPTCGPFPVPSWVPPARQQSIQCLSLVHLSGPTAQGVDPTLHGSPQNPFLLSTSIGNALSQSPDSSRACIYSFSCSLITVWTSGCLCYVTSQRPLNWYIGCCRNCSSFSHQVGSLPPWNRPPPSPVHWAQSPHPHSTNTCTAIGVPPGLAQARSSTVPRTLPTPAKHKNKKKK